MSKSSTKTAIITAILTGVFTVVAGLATYWLTTKEPELTFSVVGGPALAGITGTKRIFVVEVQNSGKKEITQTLVQLALKGGELSEVASEASPGVKLTEEKSQHQVDIHVDSLNTGDFVKVSFLTSLASPDAEPKVVVRAAGVQAIETHKKSDDLFSKGKFANIVVLLAAALGAVLSTFLMLSRSRITEKLGLPSSIGQSEVGAFVCGACRLFEESDRIRFSGRNITYRGIADYLRHRALQSKPEDRLKYTVALRALFLNEEIATSSIDTVRETIDAIDSVILTNAEFEQIRREAIDAGNEPVAWREKVEAYVSKTLQGS